MITFKDILNEITIANPSEQFRVTPKGKQTIEDIHNLVILAGKYGVDDLLSDEGMEKEAYRTARILNIYCDVHGEGMIKTHEINTLEEFLKLYISIWSDDIEAAKDYLKIFIKEGYITPIKL